MKKLLLSMAAVALFTVASFAQVSYGFKAGLNVSKEKTVYDDGSASEKETSDARISMNFGGFLVKEFNEKFAIQPEFVISFEGGKEEGAISGFDYKSVNKLSFINLPVMVRFTPVEKLNLYAGPQFGINIGAKNVTEFDGDTEDEDIADEVSTLGVAFGFGAGFFVTDNIEINLRYNAGLSNWYNGEDSDDYNYKLNVLQIGAAYKLK